LPPRSEIHVAALCINAGQVIVVRKFNYF